MHCITSPHPRLDPSARKLKTPYSRPAMARPRTLSTRGKFRTPPSRTQAPSTERSTALPSSRSASAATSDATQSYKRTQISTPLGCMFASQIKKLTFAPVPVGHAGTTLSKTHQSFVNVMSATRSEIERSRTRREVINPDTDSAARSHVSTLFKSPMRTLTKLAQSRFV